MAQNRIDSVQPPQPPSTTTSVSVALSRVFEHLAPHHLNESNAPRPPAIVPEAVEVCVELLRFICFPDIIRCPLPTPPLTITSLQTVNEHPSSGKTTPSSQPCEDVTKTGTDEFCHSTKRSPPPTPSNSHFCHVLAVRQALMRFAEILEVQLVNALMVSEFERRIHINSTTRTPMPKNSDKNNTPSRASTNATGCDYLEFPTAALLGVEKTFNMSNDDFMSCCDGLRKKGHAIVAQLLERIPKLKVMLALDVEAAFLHDVAAESLAEVILCYPGVQCLIHHRLAHELLHLGAPRIFARLISELSHSKFGIDIHPQTTIGHSCFLDHGTGIVIGATAIIGNRVSIYQGATLGAKAFPVDPITGQKIKSLPRHPIIQDDVVIYANATVLGRITVGKSSILAGSVWVDKDVPPNSLVLQKPMTITKTKKQKAASSPQQGSNNSTGDIATTSTNTTSQPQNNNNNTSTALVSTSLTDADNSAVGVKMQRRRFPPQTRGVSNVFSKL